MSYYLAIDIGTTNWKTAVYDERGELVTIERVSAKTHTDDRGNHFYRADELWGNVCTLCRIVTKRAGRAISGVSVTGIAEAVAAIDKDGKVLGDIIAWFDTRSIRQAEKLRTEFGAARLYEITGLDVNPIFSLPKILWIRENCPEVYEKTTRWLQMADYILFCLTGESVTDYTLASRTLAFDVTANAWSREILDTVKVPISSFPRILESGTVIGRVSKVISELTGITKGAGVAVGGNDHPCASIAAGVLGGNKILDSSGTAESFLYISPGGGKPPMKDGGLRICRYLQKERYVLWGGIICSGRSFDWAYEMLTSSACFGIRRGSGVLEEILAQLKQEKGMEDGLFFYPHLRGAGAPHWNPRMRGSFVGLKDTHTAKQMLRSVLEGLCMQARMIVELEERVAGVTAESLCVVGGSARNVLWQRIKADVLHKKIEQCGQPESASQGAAMLAAIGDGIYKNIEEASDHLALRNTILYPHEPSRSRYDRLYDLYCEGYEHLREFNEKLYEAAGERQDLTEEEL